MTDRQFRYEYRTHFSFAHMIVAQPLQNPEGRRHGHRAQLIVGCEERDLHGVGWLTAEEDAEDNIQPWVDEYLHGRELLYDFPTTHAALTAYLFDVCKQFLPDTLTDVTVIVDERHSYTYRRPAGELS